MQVSDKRNLLYRSQGEHYKTREFGKRESRKNLALQTMAPRAWLEVTFVRPPADEIIG